jgi:16S rRNA (cytosine967-C5)-methyltransferase
MLYATCSILPQENALQISQFLADTTEAQLIPFSKDEILENPGRQILPGEGQMDGFYYARLLKSTDKQ